MTDVKSKVRSCSFRYVPVIGRIEIFQLVLLLTRYTHQNLYELLGKNPTTSNVWSMLRLTWPI